MDDLVERAREVLEGVTPGPWRVEYKNGDTLLMMGDSCQMCDMTYYPWTPDNYKDWPFIAASRELVPAMADRIEAQSAEIARLRLRLKSIERAPRHVKLADHDLVEWMADAARATLGDDQ